MTTSAKIGNTYYRFYRETDIMRARALFNSLATTVTQEEIEDRMESEDIDFIYDMEPHE